MPRTRAVMAVLFGLAAAFSPACGGGCGESGTGSGGSGGLGASAPTIHAPALDPSSSADVLSAHDWSHFAGATVQAGAVAIAVTHKGRNILVGVGGKDVATIEDHGVFASGQVWFGADAALSNAGFRITSLRAAAIAPGTLAIVDAPSLASVHGDPGAL